jgi:hypothetical protein
MGGGVVDFLKAIRGARTKLGDNCPFYSVVWRRGGGHLIPKTLNQVFTGGPFDARADPEQMGLAMQDRTADQVVNYEESDNGAGPHCDFGTQHQASLPLFGLT